MPDPISILAVWALGGLITACGALSIAELAAMLPSTGGFYVFLREGWGRPVAFLLGWAELVLIRASALGGIANVFGAYALRSVGLDPVEHGVLATAVSAGAIIVAGAINILGVNLAASVVGLSTLAKFGTLLVIVAGAFLLGGSHGASLSHLAPSANLTEAGAFGLALVSVLWAYDGFADLSFVSGEVREPHRTLPRALVLGTGAILAIYLLTNVAYLYVIPLDQLAASPLIAADTMLALFGAAGVTMTAVVVAVSTFGSLNGAMLAAPRVFFAMAEDGLFFKPVAAVHPRFNTPWVAITLSSALGAFFVATRTFEQLTDTFVLAIWPFYALSAAAVYRLRLTRPDLPRPYRVWGYPVVPFVFLSGVVYLILNAFITDTAGTSLVFGIILAGLPVYWMSFRGTPRPH